MLKKIAGVYVNPFQIAAIDVHLCEQEDPDTGEPVLHGQPILVLQSGYTVVTPCVEPIEAIEKALEMVMREIEVGH